MNAKLLTTACLLLALGGLSAQEDASKKDGWVSLFDGESLAGWVNGAGKAPGDGWKVEEGAIRLSGRGGDIFTRDDYYNFEMEFEWKVAKGSNSGVKYRFSEYQGKNIGCEYQVLDDANHSNGKVPKQTAGSLYDVLAPDETAKSLKQIGEWNQSRIVAKDARVEHWLNGRKVLEVDMEGDAWKEALSRSKFRDAPTFGQKSGRIMLQDHGDPVWFRNLRVKKS